ncbi:MAG: flagellar biosynthesis protein FlhF [Clostridia bacterium]|nr:flagellar biosynthesis protein FlhF [Clostridia bacterium]
MRIKRYLVRDMQEAYIAIRRDLGPEAVIVATRKVRQPGLKGFFLPPRLEVTAALDTVAATRTPSENTPSNIETTEGRKELETAIKEVQHSWPGLEGLKKELADIKSTLLRLTHNNKNGEEKASHWQQVLEEQELDTDLIASLIDGIDANSDSKITGDVICSRLAEYLSNWVAKEDKQRVQVFVGPTGVGKTTTLAKIAAHYSLNQKQKVGLITLDTYRIGAVDQLRTYADIMGLPLEVAMTPKEFKDSLERLDDCNYILVDTAGRAPDNKSMLTETRGFLETVSNGDIYLVLSTSTRRQDLLKAIERFSYLNYNKLIFTKLDETNYPGIIVSALKMAGVPLAYITDGQDVPEDLEQAKPYSLAQRIWKAVVKDGSGG